MGRNDATPENCWLCDEERGEACHVHEEQDAEPSGWSIDVEE